MSSSYRWVIVAAGALMTCVALGAMFSLAIFQTPIATDTGWSHTGIASAMTLNFIVMGVGGFMWGALSDRFGPRPVVLIGALLLGLALVLASRAGSLMQFQLTYGVLVGDRFMVQADGSATSIDALKAAVGQVNFATLEQLAKS